MQNLVYLDKNRVPVTNSRLIAQAFGKRHDNVLQAIDRMLLKMTPELRLFWVEHCKMFALPADLPVNSDGSPRYRRTLEMTREGFVLLAMGFIGRAAFSKKLEYIAEFNRLEADLLSTTPRAALVSIPGLGNPAPLSPAAFRRMGLQGL
jgi:Rha family phage regulatory protein